jgi:hypothetical protein
MKHLPTTVPPGDRRTRLEALAAAGVARLSNQQIEEAEIMVKADADEWRAEICLRILRDVEAGKYTRREIAGRVGINETSLGQMLIGNTKLSERIIAHLSIRVPGYEDSYLELRRRLDRLWLSERLGFQPALQSLQDEIVAHRAAQAVVAQAVPAAMGYLSAVMDALKKAGPGSV